MCPIFLNLKCAGLFSVPSLVSVLITEMHLPLRTTVGQCPRINSIIMNLKMTGLASISLGTRADEWTFPGSCKNSLTVKRPILDKLQSSSFDITIAGFKRNA